MAAAAMAPLLIGSQIAHAQTTVNITSDTSTPVATATASNGGPADVTLSSTFTIKDANPALTLNSNNSLANAGTINAQNVNNATAIMIQGPFTGSVTNSGTINLTEDYTPSDSANTDGLTEAPYAQGTGRIGIRLTGPLTGSITNNGAITIQGNSSVGISIENTLTGSLVQGAGAINMAGDNSFGIRTTGEITGDVNIGGSVNLKGQNSVGVQTSAPIDGALKVYANISTTGYTITTRETGQIQTNIQKTPADVEQSGSALQIAGDVKGGVFLAAPPSATAGADLDGDGVDDSVEAASSLATYGSAPAIRIGGPSAISLGDFGSGINAYGLVIEGAVTGQGVMDGVSATAVDVGAGGAGVNLTGGIRASGQISAAAFQADATAIHLETGATGGGLFNTGTITANVTSAGVNTATAVRIDSGASLGSLTNSGAITASTSGDAVNAIAVVDKGGGIASVTNYGTIAASLGAALPGEPITGKGVALDLSANTTGVTLLQQQGAGLSTAPAIAGDVYLSPTGSNNVSLLAGSLTGALSLGAAPGSLTIDNGANYTGALTYSGSQLNINVANGVLNDKSATTVGATSLTVGGSSTLGVALDPAHNASTLFNVSGAATFASGAKISANLLSAPTLAGETFTVVKAGSLSVGTIDSSLLSNLPYLFNGSVKTDTAANTISLTVSTKTPAQMGFNKSETAAFNAIYSALPQATDIQSAIISAPNRTALLSAYDQLLPNSSGDVFETALGMSKAVSRAASDRFDTSMERSPDEEDEDDYVVSGFWASEFYSGMEQKKADNNAYHSAALGVIGGYDFGGTGFTFSAASSNITRPDQAGDSLNSVSVIEGGFYAAPRFGALSIDARLGAGYLKVSNRRQLVTSVTAGDQSTSTAVEHSAEGDWSGYDLTAHLGAGLQMDVGKHLFFQPRVYADVFHLHENAYGERNGGPGFDFNVSQRDSTQTNATASLVTGLRFGNQFVISPQLEVGYDKVVTGGPGDTTARFAYGGPSFTVAPNRIDGAAVGRITLRGDGNYVHFSLQAGGEYSDNYHSLDAKAVFRLTF